MIVFIHIPFWLLLNVIFNWNNYFVAINHCFKSAEVLFSHYVIFILYKFLSLIIHIFFEFIAHRRVSNAFKKFDSFFSFQIFQPSKFFLEILIILLQFFQISYTTRLINCTFSVPLTL
jgi:hypothetical protein